MRQQPIHAVKLDAAANDNWQLRTEASPAASHTTFPLLQVTDSKNKKRGFITLERQSSSSGSSDKALHPRTEQLLTSPQCYPRTTSYQQPSYGEESLLEELEGEVRMKKSTDGLWDNSGQGLG